MIDLTLPGMTCGHCVRAVTETVHRVDPSAKIEIDLATHRVQIDSSKPAQAFVAPLAEEGYAPA